MDKTMNKVCLKCSQPAQDNSDYCSACSESMSKTASENRPETLREAVDEAASKFQIPKRRRIKKNESDWIF